MDKKNLFGILAGTIIVIAICITQIAPIQRRIFRENTDAVERVVMDFGEKIKNISLQSPKEIVEKDIRDNYSGLVTDELLASWMVDFSLAPGRITSSPWPAGIRIQDIKKIDGDKYKISGKVIEVTSVEEVQGGVANEYNIEMIVEKRNGKRLIAEYKNLGSFLSEEEKLKENINIFMAEMSKTDDFIGKNNFYCSNKLYGFDEKYAYAWVYCSGFIVDDKGDLEQGTAFSGPARLEYQGANFQMVDFKQPKDGSLYSPSLKELFPEKFYNLPHPSNEEIDKLEQEIINKAKNGFILTR